jgi:hypothetical protein
MRQPLSENRSNILYVYRTRAAAGIGSANTGQRGCQAAAGMGGGCVPGAGSSREQPLRPGAEGLPVHDGERVVGWGGVSAARR